MQQNRPKWQLDLTNYFLDNLFNFITMGAAAFIFIRHQFHPYTIDDFPALATWIIAILGLLAVSGLWEKHRQLQIIQRICNRTNEIVEKKLTGQVNAIDFFWTEERKISKQDFINAKEIYVVGMVLNRTIRDNLAIFGDKIAEGTNLKFILVDPKDDKLMKILPLRSYGRNNSEWWRSRIQQTIGHIEGIPNIEKPKGSLQIGYLPYFPSFGMWLIDPDQPNGLIVIEIYHHRSAVQNPTFLLKASEDSYWYSFFKTQYNLLWESCEQNKNIQNIIPPDVTKEL